MRGRGGWQVLLSTVVALLGGAAWASWEASEPDALAAAPRVASWEAPVGDLHLHYHLVDLRELPTLGYAVRDYWQRRCHIYIDVWLTEVSHLKLLEVVLHEVGHCVDLLTLDFDHNGFVSEGCFFGDYYCDPAEGYAESWRYAYLAKCGANLGAVGFRFGRIGLADEPCELPDARRVEPARVAELYRLGTLRKEAHLSSRE
jgi:hypothetical protein